MTERQQLVETAERILRECGIYRSSYDNIYVVEVEKGATTSFAVHVALFSSHYPTKRKYVEARKRERKNFKKAAKKFRDETGVSIRKIG